MLHAGDIVTVSIDITGRAVHAAGEVLSASLSPWGDVRYDILTPVGPVRASERHVTLDADASARAGLTELEKYLALAA